MTCVALPRGPVRPRPHGHLLLALVGADRCAEQTAEAGAEGGEVGARNLGAAGEGLAERIDRDAIAMDLEMEMRTGREAGRADIADHRAPVDGRAGANRNPAHMAV